MVAQALHRGHDVAGDDHGAAGGGVVPQDRLDRLGGDRVDGLEGLIQDQDGGRVNHGAGQVDLLAHTRRVVGYQGGSGIPQPQYLDQLSRPGHDDVALEPAQESGVGDELKTVETVEGAQPVGQDPQEGLGPLRLCPHVNAMNEYLTGVRSQ